MTRSSWLMSITGLICVCTISLSSAQVAPEQPSPPPAPQLAPLSDPAKNPAVVAAAATTPLPPPLILERIPAKLAGLAKRASKGETQQIGPAAITIVQANYGADDATGIALEIMDVAGFPAKGARVIPLVAEGTEVAYGSGTRRGVAIEGYPAVIESLPGGYVRVQARVASRVFVTLSRTQGGTNDAMLAAMGELDLAALDTLVQSITSAPR